MNFSKEEECTILGKKMLTNESTNTAQSLLSKQFPKVCGFQDTLIGKLQEFDVIPTEMNYIQILHDSSLHWVSVANMESRKKDNEMHYLYDSLKKKHISKDVTAQTASTHTILAHSWQYCLSPSNNKVTVSTVEFMP